MGLFTEALKKLKEQAEGNECPPQQDEGISSSIPEKEKIAEEVQEEISNIPEVNSGPELERSIDPCAKKVQPKHSRYRIIFFTIALLIVCGELVLFNITRKPKAGYDPSLVLSSKVVKTDFVLGPTQTVSYSIGLDKPDLGRFKSLKFLAKTGSPEDAISLRVEFTNALKEQSEVYIRIIPGKWKEYSIDLGAFKKITDWTSITALYFILEAWNSNRNKGTIYFDKVYLTK